MFGIGLPELIVLVLVFFLIAVPFIAVFYCRKHYPGRLWIGIVLCLFNGGMGQFYLPGGTKFFFLTFVLYVVLVKWSGYGILFADLFAAGIFYWRYLKLQQKPYRAFVGDLEQKP